MIAHCGTEFLAHWNITQMPCLDIAKVDRKGPIYAAAKEWFPTTCKQCKVQFPVLLTISGARLHVSKELANFHIQKRTKTLQLSVWY